MSEGSEIQQAVAPLMRGIDKLETQYERLIVRIDNLPLLYMTRQEYEPRHKSLEDLIEDQKEEIKALKQKLDAREQNAIAHNITIGIAVLTSVLSIVLHFVK